MREVWTDRVREPFTVHDMQAHMPQLAYTTVMTTLHRLAEKGLLTVEHLPGQRAHVYRPVSGPEGFLLRASRRQVEDAVERFGETALAAFAALFPLSSQEQQTRLQELGSR